jgi:hypothetical protein
MTLCLPCDPVASEARSWAAPAPSLGLRFHATETDSGSEESGQHDGRGEGDERDAEEPGQAEEEAGRGEGRRGEEPVERPCAARGGGHGGEEDLGCRTVSFQSNCARAAFIGSAPAAQGHAPSRKLISQARAVASARFSSAARAYACLRARPAPLKRPHRLSPARLGTEAKREAVAPRFLMRKRALSSA